MHCFLVAIEGNVLSLENRLSAFCHSLWANIPPSITRLQYQWSAVGLKRLLMHLGELTASSQQMVYTVITHHAFFHTVFLERFVYLFTHKLNAAINLQWPQALQRSFESPSAVCTTGSLCVVFLGGLLFLFIHIWTLQSYNIIWNRETHGTTIVPRDTRLPT